MTGQAATVSLTEADRQAAAAAARAAVMDVERGLGYLPVDVELEKRGYDIESKSPSGGSLRFIEVKGRIEGADTITVTKNEILYSFNEPEKYILAIVELAAGSEKRVHYLRRPFEGCGINLDFNGASVNFPMADLLARAGAPS
jgi:hypothetical protein